MHLGGITVLLFIFSLLRRLIKGSLGPLRINEYLLVAEIWELHCLQRLVAASELARIPTLCLQIMKRLQIVVLENRGRLRLCCSLLCIGLESPEWPLQV